MNRETKELYNAAEDFMKQVESSVSMTIPSLAGYYNTQLFCYFEKLPSQESLSKYEQFSGTHCLQCGIKYKIDSVKLKYQRKMKRLKNINRSLFVYCQNCKIRSTVKSHFKFPLSTATTITTKTLDMRTVLSPQVSSEIPTGTLKSVSTSKLQPMQNLNNQINSNTPIQSSTLLDSPSGSTKSRKRNNRGKSFSPLQSMEKPKKTRDKPSLLSFLTSL
jgi:hypothetical protein